MSAVGRRWAGWRSDAAGSARVDERTVTVDDRGDGELDGAVDLRHVHVDDRVAATVDPAPSRPRRRVPHTATLDVVGSQVERAVSAARDGDEALAHVVGRNVVLVPEALAQQVLDAGSAVEVDGAEVEQRPGEPVGHGSLAPRPPGAVDLVRPHLHPLEDGPAERGHHRHVERIAATSDEDTTLARLVVARVERVPGAAEVHLDPRREVHRLVHRLDLDLRQVAEHVAGRDAERTAEAERDVGEVAAHARPRLVHVGGRRQRRAAAVGERDVVVDVVDDGGDAAIAGSHVAEQLPRLVGEHVGQDVAAGQRVDEHVVGELAGGRLGGVEVDLLGGVGHGDEGVEAQRRAPDRAA